MKVTIISGIGAASEEALRQHGIITVEQVAVMEVGELVKIHGFGAVRAQGIVNRAKEIVAAILEESDLKSAAKVEKKKKKEKKAKKIKKQKQLKKAVKKKSEKKKKEKKTKKKSGKKKNKK